MPDPDFPQAITTTEAELVTKLLPYIQGYPWALDTIGDLWRMGAPVPHRPIGTPYEQRILIPSQFKRWWADVQRRMGHNLSPREILHGN